MEYSEKTLQDIARFRDLVEGAAPQSIVFFGGAGVSTESGIPDFRSADGLYRQTYGDVAPETMISRTYFDRNPEKFFAFYFDRMVATEAEPNRAHRKLALALEREGKLSAIVTQNIDGLHQKAGSSRVLELHGSVLRNHCMKCGRGYTLEETMKLHDASPDGVPRCPACSGIVKPDVVLYEEQLDERTLIESVAAIQKADILIIAGTSLVVYPAAGLIDYFNGRHLVIVNLSPTSQDRRAELCIAAKVGDVFDF